MTFGLIYWILMLLWLVFGLFTWWAPGQLDQRWNWLGNSGFLFVLFLLLGWRVFGAPIQP